MSAPIGRLRGIGGGSRRWPLARLFAVGAGVGALLAVTAVALGVFALLRLTEARNALVDVTSPALLSAQQLSVALLDQETALRGFTLSGGRPEFLNPYEAGLAAEAEAAAVLRELAVAGELDLITADVERIGAEARQWRSGFAEPTIAAGTMVADPVQERLQFTQVREAVGTLLDELRAERVAARDRVLAASAFVYGVGIAVTVMLAGFLLAAAIGLRRGVLVPVSDLAAQVRDVVSGDVQQPVRAAGPREIVDLGADVESMRTHILRDLASAQETNRRLDQQAAELARSNRDLEQFAYVASHDLQEPLRKVASFCQLLARRYGGQLDDRADQYIEFAVDGAHRMQHLINDLLAFSRVGRSTDGFVPVPLGEAAAAAAAQVEPSRAEVDGEIVIGDLPTVPGDAGLLRQMLVNLLGNGLKFHRDGIAPVVEVEAVRSGDEWEILVRDNGIGIDAEYGDKVFVIFQRLHARDVYPGTGIGLSLAKKIAEFHGGRIELDPTPPPGATLRVTLPAAPLS